MDTCSSSQFRQSWRAPCGMILVALLSITPLLVEPIWHGNPLQRGFFPPYVSVWAAWGTKIAVLLALLLCIKLCTQNRPGANLWVIGFCMALSGFMVLLHWTQVDTYSHARSWQKYVYLSILHHQNVAPHNLRPLPYGFARLLEWLTHDWTFSCVVYRWFFTFWFLLASYRFARLWLSPALSAVVLVLMGGLYHYSIFYYGQLTDPLSHWLFVMALIFVVEDQWLLLALALGMGVLAKETALVIVPGYLACWWRNGWPAFRRTAALGAVGIIAFVAVRLPYGWQLQYKKINGVAGTMLWENLKVFRVSFIHLALFFLVFIPFIACNWRKLDPRLKALCLTVAPLVLLTTFWFGWIYESRNYMPLVPLLASSALIKSDRINQVAL